MQGRETQRVSTAELAAGAAAVIASVRDTGQAVIVTQNGEPAAVLVSSAEFALLQEHRRFVAAVEEGLADVDAGRVLTTEELKLSLEAQLGPLAWR